MQKMIKIDGVSENLIAHTQPIASIPELEYVEPKHQTLIDKCVKSLIKQRLNGSIVNHKRIKSRYQSNERPINKSQNMDVKRRNSSIGKYLNSSINISQNQNANQLSSQLLIKEKINRLNNLKNLRKRQKSQNAYDNPETQRAGNSFISAIDVDSYPGTLLASTKLNSANSSIADLKSHQKSSRMNSDFHLPKIRRERTSMFKQKNPSIIKSFVKKPVQDLVSIDVWRTIVSKDSQVTKKRRRKSSMMAQINMSLPKNFNKQTNTPLLPNSQTTSEIASKQQIQKYIENLPTDIKFLCQEVLNFFQIKIPAQLSIRNYSDLLEGLKNIHSRGWSALGFIFWDKNADGLITMSDLFKRFRQFKNINDSDDEEQEKQPQEITKQPRKKKRKQHHICNILQQKIKDLSNITQAREFMDNIVNRLSKDLNQQKYQKIQLGQEDQTKIKYLQEAILVNRKKKITYRQIQPLLSASSVEKSSSRGEEKQPELQLFPKDLNIKCSSFYRQSFVATEHNQQTRMMREIMENNKADLKQIKMKRNQLLRKSQVNQLPLIKYKTYEKFVEEGYGNEMKQIAMHIFGNL